MSLTRWVAVHRLLELGGEYHSGESAWSYVKNHTGVDLKAILENMAKEKASGS